MNPSMREWLTPEEYATERKLHIKTVYRMIKRGEIPAQRYGKRTLRIIVIRHTKGADMDTRQP